MTNPTAPSKIDMTIPSCLITPVNLNRARIEAAKATGLDRFEWLLVACWLEGTLALGAAPALAAEQPAGGDNPRPTPPTDPGELARGRPVRHRPPAVQRGSVQPAHSI